MEQRAPAPGPSSVPPYPPSEPPGPVHPATNWQRFKRILLGGPKDFQDPHLFHSLSLAAFLAWVGLGADGLSSSAYGPEEAFKNLGEHQYLAIFLALATGLTVLVISAAYTKIIDNQVNNTFNTAASMDLNSLETRKLPQDLYVVNYSGVITPTFFVEGLVSRRRFTFEGSGAKSTDLIDGTLMIDNARNYRYWSATFCGEPQITSLSTA